VFLTGYDVQAINLRDVLVRGSIAATSNRSTPGSRSITANSKFLQDAATTCAAVPTTIPASALDEVRQAFVAGTSRQCENVRIGGSHDNFVGYATIDLVATCRSGLITNAETLDTLLFDNVLTGDWQIVNPDPATGNLASGSPLVHLRAIPEGGSAGEAVATNLPYTFYDRFETLSRKKADRRQPLPSAFGARYIQGGASGFNTNFIVWREGRTIANAACADYARNSNVPLAASTVVRFDERENPATNAASCGVIPECPALPGMPTVVSLASTSTLFPPLTSGDVSGWMALNLDHGEFGSSRPSQNWLVPLLTAEGRYSAARDATVLANGCSPAMGAVVGPGANVTP